MLPKLTMFPRFDPKMILLLALPLYILVCVNCEEMVDVMKTSNVTFPYSSTYPAMLNASHSTLISEFTICLRFNIESYNDQMITLLHTKTPDWSDHYYYNGIGWKTGYDLDGFQGTRSYFKRNVEGGGLNNKAYPRYINYVLARNIDISTWTHFCTTYSSTLRRLVRYQNGQKVMGVQFQDEKDNPLPSDFFAITQIAGNLRGMFTDLNIYSTYFDTEALIRWTTGCDNSKGEIYAWDVSRLDLSQKMNVSIIKMDRKEVCPTKNKKIAVQEAKKDAKKTENQRFKPKLPALDTFVGSVLEILTTSEILTTMQGSVSA